MAHEWEIQMGDRPATPNERKWLVWLWSGAGSLTNGGSTPHESAASPDFSYICELSHRVGEVHLPGIASCPSITATTLVPESLEWKQVYLAAALEKDRTRIVGLIHDARSKLSARLVELAGHWYSHDEVEAIQDVEYLLQALQSSLSYRNDLQNWSDVLPSIRRVQVRGRGRNLMPASPRQSPAS